MTVYRTALAALFSLGMAGSPLQAAEGPDCGKFQVFHEYISVELVDRGTPGLGVGDARVGHVRAMDEDRKELGRQHFQAVVIPGGGEGYYQLIGNGHEVFDNGTISWSGSYRMAKPGRVGPPPEKIVVSIVGGTGDYNGARGTLTWFTRDDGRRVGEFDIVCIP